MWHLCANMGKGIMRLVNIIELVKQYLLQGAILAVIAGGVAGAGYFIVYKKMMKGERRIRPVNVLWTGAFSAILQ